MLTPAFQLSQNDTFITLVVKARYARVSETEVFVDGKMVKFYSKPYFLRLTLPGALVEDGRESAEYDAERGAFTIRIPKATPGETFDGLDMLTRLMAPTGEVTAAEPTVETLASSDAVDDEEEEDGVDDINWEVEQTPCELDEDDILSSVKYGFAARRSGVFSRLQEELSAIVDVPSPDETKPSERRKLRLQDEQEKFDDEHYLGDLFQDDMIQPLLIFRPSWEDLNVENDSRLQATDLKLTDEEQERMRKLPKKKFILEADTEKEAYMGLVDILLSFAFNNRCTEGENGVESAWTICKISSTLSWLDTHTSLQDVMVSFIRRALCYPLYRHWELVQAVCRDVKVILGLGRIQILRALLSVHSILAGDDPHYILNELYITDYCIWIQDQPHQRIARLAESLSKITIEKSDIGLDLEELEAAGRCVLEEDVGDEEDASPAIEMHGYPHLLEPIEELHSPNGSPQSSGEPGTAKDMAADCARTSDSDDESSDSDDESSDWEDESTDGESSSSEETDPGSRKATTAAESISDDAKMKDQRELEHSGTSLGSREDVDEMSEELHHKGEVQEIADGVKALSVCSGEEKKQLGPCGDVGKSEQMTRNSLGEMVASSPNTDVEHCGLDEHHQQNCSLVRPDEGNKSCGTTEVSRTSDPSNTNNRNYQEEHHCYETGNLNQQVRNETSADLRTHQHEGTVSGTCTNSSVGEELLKYSERTGKRTASDGRGCGGVGLGGEEHVVSENKIDRSKEDECAIEQFEKDSTQKQESGVEEGSLNGANSLMIQKSESRTLESGRELDSDDESDVDEM